MSKKTKAIKLRSKGKTYSEISEALGGVAKSTLSNWLSGLPLSKQARQKIEIKRRMNVDSLHMLGARASSENFRLKRENLLEEAKQEFSLVHLSYPSAALVGAALYWAEGAKRNNFHFANADPDMLWFMRQWFVQVLGVTLDDFRCAIHVYLNNGLSYDDIEKWWAERLRLSRKVFIKPQINSTPRSSKGKRPNRLLYGTLRISIIKPQRYRAKYFALLEKLGKGSNEFVEKN